MNKTILITWGLWYIGSHAVVKFEQEWYTTVIVDNLSNSDKKTLNSITEILWYTPDFYEVDLRNKVQLARIFKRYDFHWVLHFAGAKSPFESQENTLYYYNNNLVASINLFDLMEVYNVKNILFSSSANVYHADNISPIPESGKLGPNNPYGKTKLLVEQILEDLHDFFWMNVILLRYFNPIGSHESWLIWEYTTWIPNNIFPYIMKVATWEINNLNIFGDNYDTIDGTGVRDYIDVNDLIDWHLLAYQFLSKQDTPVYDIFNLWWWKWTSVLELVQEVEKTLDKKIPYQITENRAWDLASVYCNTKKAGEILWFKAKYSLEKSIKHTWKFYN